MLARQRGKLEPRRRPRQSSTRTPGGQPTLTLGDIVVAMDGRAVGTPGQMLAYIENNKRPGDTVIVTVVRNGQRTDVPVTLGERPQQQ